MDEITLDQRLHKLEDDGPLDLSLVDFTVNNPTHLREHTGAALNYFARVELEAERNSKEVQAILPHMDETTIRFLRVWEDQEVVHGQYFDTLLSAAGMPQAKPELNAVSRQIKIAGFFAHIGPVRDALQFDYLSLAAGHERLTAAGYMQLRKRLLSIGERAIVETGIDKIRPQESAHFAYYRAAALEKRSQLKPWQLHFVQARRTHMYAPVGAGTVDQKADFGQAMTQLIDRGAIDQASELEKLAAPVHKVVSELVWKNEQGLDVPNVVLTSLKESVALNEARLHTGF
jgi:hypothetical protein